MKLKYWGTSAAEGFPGIFCNCDACRRARALGGKNIRTRANAVVDDTVMLDFSPDVNLNRLRYGFDMTRLKALCITHNHPDHIAVDELLTHASDPFCRCQGSVLPVFCGKDVKARIEAVTIESNFDPCLKITVWKPFHTEQITDTIRITPLPARHDPRRECFIFLIQDENKFFLYAHDTRYPGDEVFDFLKDYRLDGISLDCNNGPYPSGTTHMGIEDAGRVAARLREMGCLPPHAVCVINHFSHACDSLYDELVEIAKPYGFQVSWDGMELEV